MQQQQQRELGVNEYVAIARRRALYIAVPAVLVTLLAIVVSLVLPASYDSKTLILIEQPKVPGDYVRSVVAEDLNGRLARMTEQIFSRTRLEPIIERFGIYGDGKLTIDEKLEKLRKAIRVEQVRSDVSRSGSPGFSVQVTMSQARLAQQVCGEIASMYLSENLKLREQSAEGTTDFLKTQLEDAKRGLDEQDAKLAAFQSQNFGQLPGQEQSNLNMLSSFNTQLQATTEALSRMQQDKGYADIILAQQKADYEAAHEASQGSDSPNPGAAPTSSGAAPSAPPRQLDSEIELAQARLMDLEARYTPDHPDVIKARRELDQLQKRRDAVPVAKAVTPAPAPSPAPNNRKHVLDSEQLKQLEYRVHGMDTAIAAKKAEQDRIQQQINAYQAHLRMSPMVQEKFKELSRDYETAQHFYNDLLAKKTQSEMATDLERRQEGEQFSIVDPPNLPEKPSFPNRLLFAVGGLAGGLFLGGGLAAFIELQDKSIRNEADVRLFTKLETLATIPMIGSVQQPLNSFGKLRWSRKMPNLTPSGAEGKNV